MNNSKIGRNEPCPCGSGKKYKRCCWGKEIENNQVFEPRDADQIHVLYSMGLIATYPTSIKLKDGKIISGRRELKCAIPQSLEFQIDSNNSELGKFLNNWDRDIKHKFAEIFLSEFKSGNVKVTLDGVEYNIESFENLSCDGNLYDKDGAPISDYVTVNTLGEGKFECMPEVTFEISFFKSRTEEFILLSELLNVIPNSLSIFNAAFLLDAVNFFLSDSLHMNHEFLEKNSFSPDEKINSSLKAIAEYYYKSKNTRDPEKKECERFASETLDNNDHFGKLWWKTWEVQLDMLINEENISNGQRDTLFNDWLERLVLPKDYGKEENDLRFKAAQNWLRDDFNKKQQTEQRKLKDPMSELPRGFRKIINNPKTSYSYYNNGSIGVGQHSNFSKSERQILIEVFRNPENFMTYFRNLLLTDMPIFNLVPSLYFDDLFWNSRADFSEDELKRPITFILSKARIPFLNPVDADKLKGSLYDYGIFGLKEQTGLTVAPNGIFSKVGIHNPILGGNINDFMSFYHDKNPAMIGNFEEINRIYGSNSILNSTENSFRFYFGGKFASENDQLIKSHLEVAEEYLELRASRVS